MYNILFVCYGNICRSPMAEMIFKNLIYNNSKRYMFTCASRATSMEELGNSMYPQAINKLFVKANSNRGELVIGTTLHKGKYVAQCSMINPKTGKSKHEYLGRYETQEEAFKVYKYYKENNIKEVADYYFGRIPDKLYDGLYDYEVEIDD